MAGDAKVTNSSLKFSGINYFRGNAPGLRLGSFGKKKEPLTQQNYLYEVGQLEVPRLKVQRATTATIDYTGGNAFNGSADLMVPGAGRLSPSVATQMLRHDELVLVLLEVLPADIIAAMNGSPAKLSMLRECGKDGRIVHKLFTVIEARTAKQVTTTTGLELMLTNGTMVLQAQGQHTSTSDLKLELSKNTTFAYLLLEPKWGERGKRIVGSDDDQLGPV
jgi:hypothetical protein